MLSCLQHFVFRINIAKAQHNYTIGHWKLVGRFNPQPARRWRESGKTRLTFKSLALRAVQRQTAASTVASPSRMVQQSPPAPPPMPIPMCTRPPNNPTHTFRFSPSIGHVARTGGSVTTGGTVTTGTVGFVSAGGLVSTGGFVRTGGFVTVGVLGSVGV
ncbi:hypothetical protein QJS10_CPB11g01647 [Acorus calamus]|uniref:Uncharacterized protein n=1 Tax=Acorus calamus TaxID=4465 RepID=A0AAV9DSW1_ACOCL|nr:hypothetical protein QJS10_CPB11g01647 [Acorus calamus]